MAEWIVSASDFRHGDWEWLSKVVWLERTEDSARSISVAGSAEHWSCDWEHGEVHYEPARLRDEWNLSGEEVNWSGLAGKWMATRHFAWVSW